MSLMKLSLLAASVLSIIASAVARPSFHEIQVLKELERDQALGLGAIGVDVGISSLEESYVAPTAYPEAVELPVDHFGDYNGTFLNRYWVVDEFYEPGGPIFTFDTGESPGANYYLGYLTRNASFFNQYLREFNALGILWEHRYYGESLPFPVNLDTPAEQLQYLTAAQALKDFDVFANQFKWDNYSDVDFSPQSTPWVVVGGSYPGMRAAMLRNEYPETVYASYAASPPLEARIDMSVYFDQVYRGMLKYNLGNCTANIHAAVMYMDTQLDDATLAAKLKRQFLGRTAEKGSNEGFADTLAYPLYNWQSYGIDATLQSFCDYLEASPGKSGKALSDWWANWPGFIDLVNSYGPSDSYCEGPLVNGTALTNGTALPNCLLDERFNGTLSISWTWQYCTEWGFFQSTNLGPNALGSKYNSLQHQQEICYRQFPDGLSSGYLPAAPKVAATIATHGGWAMRPSNVFFTEGQFDPWRTLSPLSNEAFAPNYTVTQNIPDCGVSTSADEIFGWLLPDAQHCYDFDPVSTYPPAGTPVELFKMALKSWLPCFGKRYAK
ncbi:hypothetical protein RUND412_001618 [Rhizina undulata]